MADRQRMFGTHTGDLLTQEEVNTLTHGQKVRITWDGGNGPHIYTIHVDQDGSRYAAVEGWPLGDPIEFVGNERNQTWVSKVEEL